MPSPPLDFSSLAILQAERSCMRTRRTTEMRTTRSPSVYCQERLQRAEFVRLPARPRAELVVLKGQQSCRGRIVLLRVEREPFAHRNVLRAAPQQAQDALYDQASWSGL